jgi:hypothetical protein
MQSIPLKQLLGLTASNPSAPTAGQVLTAISGTDASWQTPSGGGGGTLQAAYDFGGAGAGRTITANSGAVQILKSSVDANNALDITVSAGTGLAARFSGASISCPQGSGTTPERFGAGATINNNGNFAIAIGGTGATTNGLNDCIAIGHSVTAGTASGNARAIVMGKTITAGGTDLIGIGNSITVGDGNNQGSDDCIAIGNGVIAGNPFLFDFACIAIGNFAGTAAGGFLHTSSPGGTVTVTNGSPTVTGTTVGMFDGFQVGSTVRFGSQPGTGYTISAVPNSFTLTLSSNYTGTTSSGVQVLTANGDGGYIAIGEVAGARGGRGECIAIGTSAIAGWGPNDKHCIAIGHSAKVRGANNSGNGAISMGWTAQSYGSGGCVAIGGSATAGNSGVIGTGSDLVAIGLATAGGLSDCVAVGRGSAGFGISTTSSSLGDSNCVAIGNAIAAGRGTIFAANSNTTTVTNGSPTVTNSGASLWTSQLYAGAEIAFAAQAGVYYTISSVDSDTQITLTTNYTGTSSSTTSISQRVRDVIVLGASQNGVLTVSTSGTGKRYNNVLVAGSVTNPIKDVYFGSGIQSETSTAPSNVTIHGSNGSKTTNTTGAHIFVAGGMGYAAANSGGDVGLQVALSGTGTTLATQARLFSGTGYFALGNGPTTATSRLHVQGSSAFKGAVITSSTNAGDETYATLDATSGNVIYTLPAVATCPNRRYKVVRIDSSGNTATVAGNGAETINGSNTFPFTAQYDAFEFWNNGTAWYVW